MSSELKAGSHDDKVKLPSQQQMIPPKILRLRRFVLPVLEEYVTHGQIVEKDADVTFHCSDGIVKAHKVILAIVSDFFSKLFRHQAEEATIIIPDIEANVLRIIINLLYKGEVFLTADVVPHVAKWLVQFGLRLQEFSFGTAEIAKKLPLNAAHAHRTPTKTSGSSTNGKDVELGKKVAEDKENQGKVMDDKKNMVFTPTFWMDGVISGQNVPQGSAAARSIYQGSGLGSAVVQQPMKKLVPVVRAAPGALKPMYGYADDPNDPGVSSTPAKRPPLVQEAVASEVDSGDTKPRILKGGEKISDKICHICSCAFSNAAQWKWHTERHLRNGLFKCTVCRRTFTSSRNVYHHEMTVHNVGGLPVSVVKSVADGNKSENQLPRKLNFKNKLNPRLALHHARPRQQRVTPLKLKVAAHTTVGRRGRKPKWAIERVASPKGTGRKEGGKIRWVYICKKCKHSSDSSIKAFAHYVQCSPEGEQKYEDTVERCRQGHYGDYECQLCARQYSTIQGFVVHCMHVHKDYRKNFSHIINEDKLLCIHCGETFAHPKEFHGHLNQDTHLCERPNKQQVTRPPGRSASFAAAEPQCVESGTHLNDLVDKLPSKIETGIQKLSVPASSTETEPKKLKRKLSQTELPEDPRKELFKKIVSSNPRSVRLQNRLAAAVSEEEKPPENVEVTCAVCGLSVNNLKRHLDIDHRELGMDVEIVDDSIFRCKLCSISFAAWDLLAHHQSCSGSSSQDEDEPVGPFEIPEDVGVSSVEIMGTQDLMCKETIEAALKCPVCNRQAKKLHIISECLRSHGVFRCTLCFNTYLDKEDHTKHMKRCHMNETGQLVCPVCQLARSNIGQVTSHVYATHWSTLFKKMAPTGEDEKTKKDEDDVNVKDDQETSQSLQNPPEKDEEHTATAEES